MRITITTIEKNARREGNPVAVNGFSVDLANAPALTGSEKQIAWANHIREQLLVDMINNQYTRDFPNHLASAEALDNWIQQANAGMQQIAPMLQSKANAKTWIDNRNNGIRAVLMSA